MKCANCANNAGWVYTPTEHHNIPYCNSCLPSFLKAQKNAGHLQKAPDADTDLAEAIAILNTPVVETPVVYTIEEPVVEEVKPATKKATKKVEVLPSEEE